MNTPAPALDADLPRVQALLPWFAMGVLTGEDQAFVEQWLAAHGADHPALQAELAWLLGTATLARENARHTANKHAAVAGLGDLMARIAAERPSSASLPLMARTGPQGLTWLARCTAWLADNLAPRRPAMALAVAAVVLAQTVVIGTLLTRENSEQAPLSGPSVGTSLGATQGMVLFTVAWRADAREADIRALLASTQAQIVAGPSALGLYRVALPIAHAPLGLAALRAASHLIESVQAEP